MLIGDSTLLCHKEIGNCWCHQCSTEALSKREKRLKKERQKVLTFLREQHKERLRLLSGGVADKGERVPWRMFQDAYIETNKKVFASTSGLKHSNYKVSLVPKISLIVAIGLLGSTSLLSACSTSKKVERTVVTEEAQPNDSSRASMRRSEHTEIEKSTEVEEGCGGVLSCAVDTVGTVIAFPFKAVGALLGGLF